MKRTAFLTIGFACLVAVAAGAQKQKRVMGPSQLFRIEKSSAALAAIIDPKMIIELHGEPFALAESSTWIPEGSSGYLAVSDRSANVIYRVGGNGSRSPMLDSSGATTIDVQGRLIWVSARDGILRRQEKDGTQTELARGYQDQRFAAPSDLVVREDGTVFLIEGAGAVPRDANSPPGDEPLHGAVYSVMGDGGPAIEASLDTKGRKSRAMKRAERKAKAEAAKAAASAAGQNDEPGKSDKDTKHGDSSKGAEGTKPGTVKRLLTAAELGGYPSGIAFSPDAQYLYIGAGGKKVIRYEVHEDGTLGTGAPFAEDPAGFGEGMRTDRVGNLYSANGASPGVIRVTSPDGKLLGRFHLPIYGAEPKRKICAHHVTFGNLDGKTLFIAACDAVYKLRLKSPGPVPGIVIRH